MTSKPVPAPVVNQGFEECWATWQARGAANDRAAKQKMFVMAATSIVATAILTALSMLK